MLKALLLLCCTLSGYSALLAQAAITGCDCRADFDFVRQKVETDHPGFRLNVNKRNRAAYDAQVAEVERTTSRPDTPRDSCAAYINSYLKLIRDGHLGVTAAVQRPKSERNLTADMHLKEIDRETYYLRLPTFFKSYWREIDSFYDSIIPLLATRPHLVIDVRNNTGGGERMYLQLLKYLRKNGSRPERIALLYNRYCASACEEFVLRLRDHRKVTTFGENSAGAIGYGMIQRHFTPNCSLQFDLPTKRQSRYLTYELDGVPPDQVLTEARDEWVEAVVEWMQAEPYEWRKK